MVTSVLIYNDFWNDILKIKFSLENMENCFTELVAKTRGIN